MKFIKKLKWPLFIVICIFLPAAIFGSKLGLIGFLVLDESLLKARIFSILGHLGLFSILLAIYALIREKRDSDNNWIFAAIFIIVIGAIQLGYHVNCDSVFIYCRSAPSDSEYAICYDNNKNYVC